MKNANKMISASELNKYAHCPYQWYYERFYGSKYLREINRERNRELGLEDVTKSHFNRGLIFHENFGRRRLWPGLLLLGILLAGCFLFFYCKGLGL